MLGEAVKDLEKSRQGWYTSPILSEEPLMVWLVLRRVDGYDGQGDLISGEAIGIAEYNSLSDDIHLKKWYKMDASLKAKYLDWSWEYITQAQFETYRDLHALEDYTQTLER